MSRHTKLVLVGLAVAMSMALAVNSASANHISVSHGSLWDAVFREMSFSGLGIVQGVCSLTLEGSFHSGSISKVLETQVGYITRATIRQPCIRGEATVLTATLPWEIRYGGFIGELPRIEATKQRIVGASFNVRTSLGNCLTRTTEARPAIGYVKIASYEAGGNGVVSAVETESGATIPCGSFFEGSFAGIARVREVPGGLENMLIRLI